MDGMLSLAALFTLTLAGIDDWKELIYLGFFVLAGLASALGKWKKRSQDKKNAGTDDSEVELEAEILPEPAPARKVERPIPPATSSLAQPPPSRPAPPPPTFFPARPAAPSMMKSVPAPPPFEPAQPTPRRKPRRVTQEARAKAAYQEQVEPARPPRTRTTRQPVTAKPTNLPPDVRVIRRLLANRTGQRAAVALCEVLGPPIALRDSHLER